MTTGDKGDWAVNSLLLLAIAGMVDAAARKIPANSNQPTFLLIKIL
jgi:hypothetical protein